MNALEVPHVDREFSVHDYIPGQPIPSLVRDRRTSRIVVNELKRYVKPFTLVTDPALVTLPAGVGALSDPVPMIVDAKGHFEVFQSHFVSQRSAGFTVELMDADGRPLLMNREVHVATIASGGAVTTQTGTFGAATSAGRPFRWPETFWMDVSKGASMIVARFRNLSADSNQIRFCLHGRRWWHVQAPFKVARRIEEILGARSRSFPFFYTTDGFVELAASAGPTDFPIQTHDDGWFEWWKATAVSTGRFDVRIRESSSGKRYMELAIRDDLVLGSGQFPSLLWEHSLFEPGYGLTFELTDLSAGTNTIWITLAGRKIQADPREVELLRPWTSPGEGR